MHAATIMRGPRLWAIYFLVAVAALWSLAPTQVARADRCGGPAAVDPVVGPVGTEFVFTTNVGAPSTLRLFHDGQPIRVVPLDGVGDVSYTFVSQLGDEGSWAATAEVRSATFCGSEATFTVLPPDAASVPSSPTASPGSSGSGSGSVSTPSSVALAAMAVVALVVLTYWAILRRRGSHRKEGR
jgi:hypothetical protein